MEKVFTVLKRGVIFMIASLLLTGQIPLQIRASSGGAKITQILLLNFVIGNAVAWSMGAYPRSFDPIPYTEIEQAELQSLEEEWLEYPQEAEINRDLGIIYSRHNQIDLAGEKLKFAIKTKPQDTDALAWQSSNEAKLAGAMWDFTFGIWKLWRVSNAKSGLNTAVFQEPDNSTARLLRIYTLPALGSFEKLEEDELWYQQKQDILEMPPSLKNNFSLALGYAYTLQVEDQVDKKIENGQKADRYLQAAAKEGSFGSTAKVALKKTQELRKKQQE